MYQNLLWKDHAVTPDRTFRLVENEDGTVTLTPAGTVIQQGTNLSATNFNNIEMGITDHDLAMQILITLVRNISDKEGFNEDDIAAIRENVLKEIAAEEKSLTLTNSLAYPFNNSVISVSMNAARTTKNYTVEAEVTEADGNVGEIVISDKTLNGFKIAFTGSATEVKVTIKIRGGILA